MKKWEYYIKTNTSKTDSMFGCDIKILDLDDAYYAAKLAENCDNEEHNTLSIAYNLIKEFKSEFMDTEQMIKDDNYYNFYLKIETFLNDNEYLTEDN